MASGAWSFAIGLHTFATVIFGYRLSNRMFLIQCILIWCFVYGLAIGGIHPDTYVRASAWCWVNSSHPGIRLWLHYFWIFFFEFGTVIVYTTMIVAVRVRVQTNFYQSAEQAKRANEAAKLMVAYPIIYVVCTLPLATLRMVSIRNKHAKPPLELFCFAGAMITSNGWLDVLLYTLTRRIVFFSDEPPTDNGLDSFGTPWGTKPLFGTETTCEHVPDSPRGKRSPLQETGSNNSLDTELSYVTEYSVRGHGTTDILSFTGIEGKTTVEVKSELMTPSQRIEARKMKLLGATSVPGLGRSRIPERMERMEPDRDEVSSTRRLWHGTDHSNGDQSDCVSPTSDFHRSRSERSLELGTTPLGTI
jgi:hypothetical protein